MPLKSIADRLHYDDTSHMCKVFRRHCGMSPMQYRRTSSSSTRYALEVPRRDDASGGVSAQLRPESFLSVFLFKNLEVLLAPAEHEVDYRQQ
ncbi:MAG: AraC family transcriptional regulator [Muribaculaceae bacterium]|nr:AraC family transcriptional regulator [Muribaculaceae bacterium]